ncbi:hypothetical protein HY024_00275 [Candidatus Curtissbacteria bacterium]|nr:hypothetical protein [Candidatus Curtissbacteria bacterium]
MNYDDEWNQIRHKYWPPSPQARSALNLANSNTDNESPETHEKNLDNLAKRASKGVLMHIKGVFPLDIFPDEVVVDINKVNIIRNDLFGRKIHSVYLKDISDVIVNSSIFFSSLKIVDMGFTESGIVIKNLKRGEAEEARRVIQGLVVSTKQNINLSKIDPEELRDKVGRIGEAWGIDS